MSPDCCLRLISTAPAATEALGAWLARALPDGSVVALRGDLAAGKTCLVRGMAAALGAGAPVHSPTFTLVNEYVGARRLLHLDLYRLHDPEEFMALGHEELLEPEGICVIEWAERAGGLLPPRRVDVMLDHAGGDRRSIEIGDRGVMQPGWQGTLPADDGLLSAAQA
ncbi:MAG: tRNA (adenosine(37)-N6)-threonylcarbamoyltransferase complex ATPase subunit type 1 TsaE [Candidatus Hydrogenedentes bacterium]|nr:tRNA (adenosine(37)-N6)-threonylcarbamoyltransferase complex ATPase subunit type 1 TsaE [Candidatus Hydrogenedentota bacterium]